MSLQEQEEVLDAFEDVTNGMPVGKKQLRNDDPNWKSAEQIRYATGETGRVQSLVASRSCRNGLAVSCAHFCCAFVNQLPVEREVEKVGKNCP